jgi:hypothetical protein
MKKDSPGEEKNFPITLAAFDAPRAGGISGAL